MKKYWKKMLVIGLLAVLVLVLFATARDLITFEGLKRHSDELQQQVEEHYALSVAVFGAVFVMAAFFIPGALILTLAGGFLFGAVLGAFYAAVFLTTGSVLAFLLSRYLIGSWIQQRYHAQLVRFNAEIARHGPNYLFVLRLVPVMPAFLLNYLSGMTHISIARFTLFSFLGIIPGAVIYSLAGVQLKSIQAPGDLLSAKVLIGIWLLVISSLSPVVFNLVRARNEKKRTGD